MEKNGLTHVDQHALWLPVTEQDKEQVIQQMERLLETTHFRNSRRYPTLLRFLVEETLAGRGEFLKERLLGVKVFGRAGDYDTAADPVVRVTVAEIRKRIAQYYYAEGHAEELRIELLPGRYEPEFRLSRLGTQHAASPAEIPREAPQMVEAPIPLPSSPAPVPVAELQSTPRSQSRWLLWMLGALTSAVILGSYVAWTAVHQSALDRFWAPIFTAHQPVLFCLPVAGGKYGVAANSKIVLPTPRDSGPPVSAGSYLELESLGENVVFSDVRAMLRISDLISQHSVEQSIRLNTAVTLDDLRQGPTILIGAMDNPWTLRAVSHLRYQFGGSDQETYWIVDTKTGQQSGWSLDLTKPTTSITHDYAIIARIHAEDTGQPEIIVAGIGMSGTAAAGELLTNPAQMEVLRKRVGEAFDHRDFEAVISTDVVNGIAGTPKILTTEAQ
jgi:hypothetical protein